MSFCLNIYIAQNFTEFIKDPVVKGIIGLKICYSLQNCNIRKGWKFAIKKLLNDSLFVLSIYYTYCSHKDNLHASKDRIIYHNGLNIKSLRTTSNSIA